MLTQTPTISNGCTSKPQVVSLFAGGGGKSLGAKMAGCDLVGAVEYEPAICEVYARNVSKNITCVRVEDQDYRSYAGIDGGMASPRCTTASVANSGATETVEDRISALATARFIKEARPKWFVLENVWGYRKFHSFKVIMDTLTILGYTVDVQHVNMAEYGIPQSRKRLILRAMRVGLMPPLPPKVARMTGWYEAIEDLIPTLPESEFAPWQLSCLGFMGKKITSFLQMTANTQKAHPTGTGILGINRPSNTVLPNSTRARAFIVEGTNAGRNGSPDFGITIRNPKEPALTVGASPTHRPLRAFLCSGTDANTYDEQSPSMTVTAAQGNGMIASRAFLCGVQGEGRDIARPAPAPAPAITASRDSGKYRAFIVPAGGNDSSCAAREGDKPAFTVMTNGAGRTRAFIAGEESVSPQLNLMEVAPTEASLDWLQYGRVVSLNVRCLARFQTFPDSYVLPTNAELACRIAGNALPVDFAEMIVRDLVEATR